MNEHPAITTLKALEFAIKLGDSKETLLALTMLVRRQIEIVDNHCNGNVK